MKLSPSTSDAQRAPGAGVAGGHFGPLSAEECQHKLAARSTGRVGWSYGGSQHILPVTYALYTGRIVFRTSPYGVLSELTRRTNVAFEIDEVDEVSGQGWSVLVQGSAEGIVLAQDLTTLWARPGLVPWAPGTRNVFIAITPVSTTGRAVHAPFTE
jgi:nitroimidazol reductase NimA-like FMN-containing flavoprotein (pyridoxamine 5'-phosphate oxidase superfamily)